MNTPASLRSELIDIRSESLIDIVGIATYDVSADGRFVLVDTAESEEA